MINYNAVLFFKSRNFKIFNEQVKQIILNIVYKIFK